jgi:hypothetical protein
MVTGELVDTGHAVQVAERLEKDNPEWLVMYGSYSREFVAFPVYPDAPDNCYCSAKDPAALDGHIRETERRTGHVRLTGRIGHRPGARRVPMWRTVRCGAFRDGTGWSWPTGR